MRTKRNQDIFHVSSVPCLLFFLTCSPHFVNLPIDLRPKLAPIDARILHCNQSGKVDKNSIPCAT